MARAGPVTKQRPSLYERDFYLWIEQQAARLREGRLERDSTSPTCSKRSRSWGEDKKRAIQSNLVVC